MSWKQNSKCWRKVIASESKIYWLDYSFSSEKNMRKDEKIISIKIEKGIEGTRERPETETLMFCTDLRPKIQETK